MSQFIARMNSEDLNPAQNPYSSPRDLSQEELATVAATVDFDDDGPLATKINIAALAFQASTWMRIAIEFVFALSSAVLGGLSEAVNTPQGALILIGFVVSNLSLWINFHILSGVACMQQRRNLRAAQRAGWLALLPVSPVVLFQAPIAIWVIRVMSDREVREAFGRD